MKLSKYIAMFAAVALTTGSCSDWLNVQPSDTITQENLFETGDGYRVALNGIFKQASSQNLYGKELTWGLASVCGGDYEFGYSGFSSTENAYYRIGYDFNYEDAKARSLFDNVWETSYNVIVDCNNLIGNIRNESPSKFRQGEIEKGLIMGEAMAMRAMLHFDILRLFAPYEDDGKTYVPYYDQDGLSTGQPALGVNDVLDKCVADLLEAQKLVVQYDTLNRPRVNALGYEIRFNTSLEGSSMPTEERETFFAARGYRMNYFAVTALLARVYNWMGDHEKANEQVDKILGFNYSGMPISNILRFTPETKLTTDRKMRDDLIFALSDPQQFTNYEPYSIPAISGNTTSFALKFMFWMTWRRNDPNDYRYNRLILSDEINGGGMPLKYTPTDTPNAKDALISADIVPMIRMSELYFIKAEWQASQGLWGDAANSIDMVRMGRGCRPGALWISDEYSFKSALTNEVRFEFLSEGQTFFHFKKYDDYYGISYSMSHEDFVFPRPENENIVY